MIHSITAIHHTGDSITIELTKPHETGFIITSIDGLGPVKSTINITEVTTNDGGVFNSARSSFRNIVIHMLFEMTDTESIEDIRHKSYRYFPLKKPVTLIIKTDKRTMKIVGYVESNEPNIFSEQEGCDISLICPDPNLYSELSDTIVMGYVESAFEFPFSNESLHTPLLEVSRFKNTSNQMVIYNGDSEIGILMTIYVKGDIGNITLYNVDNRDQMIIDINKIALIAGTGLTTGDVIVINTRKNNKRAILLRNGMEINILNALARTSNWITLQPGVNNLAFTTEFGRNNVEIYINNEIVYDGV